VDLSWRALYKVIHRRGSLDVFILTGQPLIVTAAVTLKNRTRNFGIATVRLSRKGGGKGERKARRKGPFEAQSAKLGKNFRSYTSCRMASRRSNELLAQLESKSTKELRELCGSGGIDISVAAGRAGGSFGMIGTQCFINYQDEFGQTALHLATQQEKSSVTEQLIAAGSDVNSQTTAQKVTPVFIAAQKGNVSITQQLIAGRCNVDLQMVISV